MKQAYKKYIIIVLGIYVLWLAVIPFIFSRIIPIICENITYNSQYNVVIDKPRLYMNIIPTSQIKANSISISSKIENESLCIRDFKLKVRLLPLLSGKVHIDLIQASKININALIEKDNKLDKELISKALKTRFICDSIKIDKFIVKIKESNVKEPVIYEGNDVYYVKNGRYLKLNIDSTVNIENNLSVFNAELYLPKNNNAKDSDINILLSNFNIAPLGDYLKNYLPADTKCIKGVIDLEADKEHLNINIKNGAYEYADEAKSIILPDILKVNSGFNLTRKDIIINNAKITSKNINVSANGVVRNYMGKPKPELNFETNINSSRIEDFIDMLPVFKTEEFDSYKLKKYKFYGDILGNLVVKGDFKEPSITGGIYVNNGILTKPIPSAAGATIKMDFKGKYIDYDVIVPAGGAEKVMVKGNQELYNVKYGDLRVWSTKHVDLATAEEKVVPIHEILNFVIGPVPIMDIKGDGNIDIIVKGNRKSPHIWGELNFNNTTVNFKEIPNLILTRAEAILRFDDENAVFNLKKGITDGKNIYIDGTCSLAGKFNFDVSTNNQFLEYLYKSIKTSTMIEDLNNVVPDLNDIKGLTNLKLKVYGNLKDIDDMMFNENVFAKGELELLGNGLSYQGITVHDIKGLLLFDNLNAEVNVTSLIDKAPMNIKASVKDNIVDTVISISKLNLRNLMPSPDKFQKEISNIFVDVSAKYKGDINNIEYDKIDFNAKIVDVAQNNKLKISNGFVSLKNGKLQIKDINGTFADTSSSFKVNLDIDNIISKPLFNGKIQLKNFELQLLNSFSECLFIPKNIREMMTVVHFDKGKVNTNASISNNSVNASTDVGGIAFTYTPLNLPVKVVNGSIYVKKNYLGLNKINMLADELPILLDGGVRSIFSKQDFDIYINTKPKQYFIDKYVNNNHLYPLKIKGDIVCWAKISGVKDDYNVQAEANMEKDSSVYYMGALIGDFENSIILNINANILKQKFVKIKEFSYDKLISSQGKRQTRLNMLKMSGGIDFLNEDFDFHDLRIKTNNPTDAKIFNVIFRKPNIKQGQFMSDLRVNGKMSNPYVIGSFNIVEANIPFLDTTLKKIAVLFKEKNIDISSSGEIFGNDVIFKGTMKNKLTTPYYILNGDVYTQVLDLNYIADKLKYEQIDEVNTFESLDILDLENMVIKNLKLSADEIRIRNLVAQKVNANLSISEKQDFKLSDFKFDIAKGNLAGNFSYNLKNNAMTLNMKANKINANDITIAMFDLNNQIYGDLTGGINLTCNGSNFNSCLQTMNGGMTFNVKDGRMPKLGSLEHLLKAGNLVKGGITGLSVNGLIDVLTPLKTGNFSEIYGVINIKKGIADDIEISTRGKDLSLFITGKYNLATSIADMEVLGILSKKISTMLGPVGNVSINTLFNVVPGIDLEKDSKVLDRINKIPGIELNEKSFRKFIVEIKGNINGDNYVNSFKWIN